MHMRNQAERHFGARRKRAGIWVEGVELHPSFEAVRGDDLTEGNEGFSHRHHGLALLLFFDDFENDSTAGARRGGVNQCAD